MDIRPELDSNSGTPLYRQLASYLAHLIETAELLPGDRLPPTRELAAQLGLNRTTVSAAYEALEQGGLIKGSVGRGSFVCGAAEQPLDWSRALTASLSGYTGGSRPASINFSASRPSERLFPVDEFRASCDEVLASEKMRSLLQLGSPAGYEPLRHYLMRRSEFATPSDDIVVTNGCQQAVDLLRRALVRPGSRVAIEEPVYPGLRNLFLEAGAELIGVPVGADGVELPALRRALEAGAKVLVLTPSFQNPTGATIPALNRRSIVDMARAAGAAVIENDIYSESGLSRGGIAPPEVARLERHPARKLFQNCVSGNALRLDHRSRTGDCARHGTEATGRPSYRPAFTGLSIALSPNPEGSRAHQAKMIEAGRERLRAVDQGVPHVSGRVPVSRPRGRHEYLDRSPGRPGCQPVARPRSAGGGRLSSGALFFGVAPARLGAAAELSRVWSRRRFGAGLKFWGS